MEINILDNGNKIIEKAKENFNMQMEIIIKEIGKKIKNMDKES